MQPDSEICGRTQSVSQIGKETLSFVVIPSGNKMQWTWLLLSHILLGIFLWNSKVATCSDVNEFDFDFVEGPQEPTGGPCSPTDPSCTPTGNSFVEKDNVLLVSWVPYPVDQWDYILVNATSQQAIEAGRVQITQFTKESFPDVTLVFTCNYGDNAYFPNELRVPIIGVDTFHNDYYFQQYLSIIYTMHGFRSTAELWAHFILHQDAFRPVRERVSSAFQEYVENYHADATTEDLARPYPEDRRQK